MRVSGEIHLVNFHRARRSYKMSDVMRNIHTANNLTNINQQKWHREEKTGSKFPTAVKRVALKQKRQKFVCISPVQIL